MSSTDMDMLVDQWRKLGFDVKETVNGKETWKDVCVIELMFEGPTLPCNWIEVDAENRAAYFSGAEAGPIVGRDASRVRTHQVVR